MPNTPLIDLSFDGHMHTRWCHHATGTMEEYVLSAIDKGLSHIVFLEHMEATGVNYFETTWLTDQDFDDYFAEGQKLQKKYDNQLRIGLGVEAGYSVTQHQELQDRLSRRSWDQIGISYHFMPVQGQAFDLNLVSRQKRNVQAIAETGCEGVLDNYFNTLIEAVRVLPGTVLCHLDAALRFQPDLQLTQGHWQQIEELLDTVKTKNMALEINTSGFAVRGTPFPAPAIIQMAITRGIPLVAGSDAHRAEDVGRFFHQLPKLLGQFSALK
ncbi:MAG: histidinol-phosphatase HisJ [Desulfocapsaceae bacterium]|nr:histidinol-phosphatase HisJ [Desulfocapsaceae bacterium]